MPNFSATFGEPEVDQSRLFVVQHNVARADVAVVHSRDTGLHVRERTSDTSCDARDVAMLGGTPRDGLLQGSRSSELL